MCPECGGTLIHDEEHGETVCEGCGLVVADNEIDHGPEWRVLSSEENKERRRVGAPTTVTLHEKGLTTAIDWQGTDAAGRVLSPRRRQQMHRLRKWHKQGCTKDATERNLKYALGEIDRMAAALDLSDSIRERASVLYRRALEEDLVDGRSIEGVASAALYAAARTVGTPRSLDEITAVSRVDRIKTARAYRSIARVLDLALEPVDPIDFLPRFASELGISDEVEREARELLQAGKEQGLHSGKSPTGLAGAAIYAAGLVTNTEVTQTAVSEVTGKSELTIRNRYQELLELVEDGAASTS